MEVAKELLQNGAETGFMDKVRRPFRVARPSGPTLSCPRRLLPLSSGVPSLW